MTITFRSFSKLLLILLLSFQFANAMANTGRAIIVKGTVAVNESELRSSDTIKEGDIIKTGANSSVTIVMKDRTVLDISENTRFEITKYSYSKEEPAKNKSRFKILTGAFRYISGLIAKNRPQNVQISIGTATIGIRGSFYSISFDASTSSATVLVSNGTATITMPDGSTVTVSKGNTGKFNVKSGESSVTPTTSPDSASNAAKAFAVNKDDPKAMAKALSDLSDADVILAVAALINNPGNYGLKKAELASVLASVAVANPDLAVIIAYVGSALDPDNSQAYSDAISEAVPDQANAIEDASNLGTVLGESPEVQDKTIQSISDTTSGTGAGGGGGGGAIVSPVSP